MEVSEPVTREELLALIKAEDWKASRHPKPNYDSDGVRLWKLANL